MAQSSLPERQTLMKHWRINNQKLRLTRLERAPDGGLHDIESIEINL
jgi:hypothetical protein